MNLRDSFIMPAVRERIIRHDCVNKPLLFQPEAARMCIVTLDTVAIYPKIAPHVFHRISDNRSLSKQELIYLKYLFYKCSLCNFCFPLGT